MPTPDSTSPFGATTCSTTCLDGLPVYSPLHRQILNSRLREELGDAYLRIRELERELNSLRVLREWVSQQAIINTPSICCPGSELEARIDAQKEQGLSAGAL